MTAPSNRKRSSGGSGVLQNVVAKGRSPAAMRGGGARAITGWCARGLVVACLVLGFVNSAIAAPYAFTTYTTANGLGSNIVRGIYASGSTIYAATVSGLSISTNGGASFINYTSSSGTNPSGLGDSDVNGVYAIGATVYAATAGGLSISTNGGVTYTNYTTTNGLGGNLVRGVFASGSAVYAATISGLSISTNGGTSYSNRTTANGLGYDNLNRVYAVGSNVYVGCNFDPDFENPCGLSISTNGGTSFTNRTTANGLGSNVIFGIDVVGNTVYAATSGDGPGTGGLSISTNGGASFITYTSSTGTNPSGLGGNSVTGVVASGSTVYAATNGGVSISTSGGTSYTNYTTASGLSSDDIVGISAVGSTIYAATWGGGVSVGTPAPLVWNTTTGTWNTTTTPWTISVGGTYAFTDGDEVIFSSTGGGTITVSGSIQPSSITVSATSGTYSFVSSAANVITGTAGLSKSGAGTLVLSGSNSFTGATSVGGGKLLINGVLSSTSTTLASAAVLGGSGTISGAVVVGASGTLSPGNSPGILTVGSLSLTGSAFTLMEIVGSGSTAGVAGTAYDQVAVASASGLSFGGTLDLDFGNRTSLFAQGTIFQLFSFSGTTSGDFTTIRTIDGSGSYANLTFTQSPYVPGEWTSGIIGGSGNQYLVFSENTGQLVALPEPSAVAMAALGMGLAGWRLVRRRLSSKAAA